VKSGKEGNKLREKRGEYKEGDTKKTKNERNFKARGKRE
jgi:hypothetical protein